MEIFATVTFSLIYFLEAVLTLLGNIFTIFVFWKRRAELKRTSYLLVNLAFADLLVAVSISFTLSSQVKILVKDEKSQGQNYPVPGYLILISGDMFCEAGSLLNLLIISLERLYAVRWPFRHRTLSTRSYIYSLAFVWAMAVLIFLLHFTLREKSNGKFSLLTTGALFLIILAIICAAYVLVCLQTQRNFPEKFRKERRVQQNKKLTNTLLIVTVLSLICWLPGIILSLIFPPFLMDVDAIYTNNTVRIMKVLQYGNSIVNPIVYTFRMPLFKSEIKKYFGKLNCVKGTPNTQESNIQDTLAVSSRCSPKQDINVNCCDTKL